MIAEMEKWTRRQQELHQPQELPQQQQQPAPVTPPATVAQQKLESPLAP